ncbi:uncharacterized protein LOC110614420 [Manihot esculenta]|uniref:Uncharacterized protein n=2 Tax=Manihot esculenta TaxID=3983 RepID=A0A251KWZ3_MANES|nr:uncharacterized protein LOC110614420 [Manihot esculenta]OAY50557.1 hypothetical protein MANES_05G145900v8 [Manihot esculenta]OAY50558.1 hypothetical protein MANES_05G145900v8 [Manihot esculenta]
MTVSDAVIGNLTLIYVAMIAGIKAYGLVTGRSFSGGFVLVVSTTLVGLILIGSLTWDVSRKVTLAISRDHIHVHEMCKGGICWHGVAVRSPASQVCFRLPHHQQHHYGPV